MRVLVTGGAGFIGGHVVRRLAAAPAVGRVLVLDDLSAGDPGRLDDLAAVELVKGSILDADAVTAASADVDAVVHLAALISVPESVAQPERYHDVNVTGTVRVLEAARRHGAQVILASSAAVYGTAPPLPTTEAAPVAPRSVYASSKLAAEAHTFAYAAAYDLPVAVLRLFNVFGPGQGADHAYAAVVPAFVAAARAGRPLTIHGDGGQTRDLVPVDLVATVVAEAVTRRVAHDGPLNVAAGTGRSVLDIVAALERVLGRSLDRRHVPARPGDVRHSRADVTTLRRVLPGLAPPDVEATLRATVEALARR